MKTVSILATGSEVASGQIVNTNAAWLAQRLSKLNLDVSYHWVVADDTAKILEAFQFLAGRTEAVFVIGGLGPTTDDLTRKLVADWLGQDLVLNEQEWNRIQLRVQTLRVQAREGHKWQAYFPAQAEIYTNLVGTASGFSVYQEASQTEFYFLPGPPLELHYIWESHLEQKIKSLAPSVGLKLLTWQFIELPESEVAYHADPVADELGFLSGYRAIPPIVEFKLWVPPEFDPATSAPIVKLERELQTHLHSTNEFDYLWGFFETLLKSEPKLSLSVEDGLTEGEFLNRWVTIKEHYKNECASAQVFYSTMAVKDPQKFHLQISGIPNENLVLKFKKEGLILFESEHRLRRPASGLRFKRWVCECVAKDLCAQLPKWLRSQKFFG